MKLLRLLVAHFGSLRSTLVLMGLLAAVVLAGAVDGTLHATALVAVSAVMALQLLVGLVQHASLRRQAPLLLFHIGLLALLMQVALGRLVSIEGRFELTEGVPFDGRLIDGRRGPLHSGALQQPAFRHEGFEIDYAPGRRRGATRNTVTWTDAAGRAQRAVIGDHRPLVLHGHRILTTPNKGFAPLLQWQPAQGEAVVGAVHLPSFPVHELQQSREWTLPDGRSAWVMLDTDERLIDPATATSFQLPRQHRLVLRLGEQRAELLPGEGVDIGGGRLSYLGLRSWMGYRISYDPLLPWLLLTALASTAALAWHYARKWRTPARTVLAAAAPPLREHAADA